MPFYVAPEQVMKDRADFARKNVARGRPLVALSFADGILVAAAEMAFAGDLGLDLHPRDSAHWFSEEPSRYLLEIDPRDAAEVERMAAGAGLVCEVIGEFNDSQRLTIAGELDIGIEELRSAWRGTLDW